MVKIIILSVILLILIAAGLGVFYFLNNRSNAEKGTLEGKVAVGPICPVENASSPCPVPPQAYTSRQVLVYKSDGKTLVASMHFDQEGNYKFELSPGNYVINIPKTGGLGTSSDLPHGVTVKAGQTTVFNFSIDTGIR